VIPVRLVVSIALACAALALSACGGDNGKPIPRSDEKQLLTLLQEAENRQQPLVCNDLLREDDDGTPTMTDLENHVRALPDSVDPDVRDALEESVVHLRQLVAQECARKEQTQTTPTETTPTETTPTETQPPETETTPTETTPTETTPTEPGPGGQPGPGEEGKKKGKKKAKETGR
jgi:hypothetical protein